MLHNGTTEDDKGDGRECYTTGQQRVTKVMEEWDNRGCQSDGSGCHLV